ncbi:MAG: SIS domain-containing protein [Anaerolineae bacterium]|nr:SIS domain-containing protein [Anaerolineae bacterium]
MSVLKKEIYEQPTVVARLLERERENVTQIAAALRGHFTHVVIAARGTSDNAARYAQYRFGAYNRLQVALATPSLYTLYERPPRLDGALVVGISQSGQSPDIVAVLAEGRRQGRPTLSITNDAQSPLARAAEYVIPLHTGPEHAVAATKTYTASLAVLALLSCLLADEETPAQPALDQLYELPALMAETLSGITPLIHRIERYRFMNRCAVIGRGYNYATAFEVALKVKELTRVAAEPYSSADFRHGPIAMVGDDAPVLLIAPTGAVSADLRALIGELQARRVEQVVISDDAQVLAQAQLGLPLPSAIPEWLTPLAAVLPGQLFGLTLAKVKGADPDNPLGLSKVTETL